MNRTFPISDDQPATACFPWVCPKCGVTAWYRPGDFVENLSLKNPEDIPEHTDPTAPKTEAYEDPANWEGWWADGSSMTECCVATMVKGDGGWWWKAFWQQAIDQARAEA